MMSFMEANKDISMVASTKEGLQRVKTSNFAFISESSTIDYQVQRNCELTQIGGLLDSKGYGLAFPKGRNLMMHSTMSLVLHVYILMITTIRYQNIQSEEYFQIEQPVKLCLLYL